MIPAILISAWWIGCANVIYILTPQPEPTSDEKRVMDLMAEALQFALVAKDGLWEKDVKQALEEYERLKNDN